MIWRFAVSLIRCYIIALHCSVNGSRVIMSRYFINRFFCLKSDTIPHKMCFCRKPFKASTRENWIEFDPYGGLFTVSKHEPNQTEARKALRFERLWAWVATEARQYYLQHAASLIWLMFSTSLSKSATLTTCPASPAIRRSVSTLMWGPIPIAVMTTPFSLRNGKHHYFSKIANMQLEGGKFIHSVRYVSEW